MTRREFVAGFVAAIIWPWAGHAQQPARVRTVGLLGASSPDTAGPWIAAFVGRLGELGWTEGKNVVIEYRWAEGKYDRLPALAADLVARKVTVIITQGTPAAFAAVATSWTVSTVNASAFASNARRRAYTLAAFAKIATCETFGAIAG